MVQRTQLEAHLACLLDVARFKDYGPNGLQVEGKAEIVKLVSGVTVSLALIEAAIERGADAILVHHGLFWKGQDGRVVGWMKERLRRLLNANINVFAYHLPLDAHAQYGNNSQLGERLGFVSEARFGEQDLGFVGQLAQPFSAIDLGRHVAQVLQIEPRVIAGDGRPLQRIAWCTGGAQSYFEGAIAAGADVFLTGELSEPQMHLARETGVAYIAAGHHATERYGAQALGAHLAQAFALEHEFIDIPNPA